MLAPLAMGVSSTGSSQPSLAENAQILAWGDQGDGTYRNPILKADYSDPDVIRVGDDFWLIASDFHYLGMQVLCSRDMVNWEVAGHAARFEYSLDGLSFTDTGISFPLRFGHWKGARVGIFCYGRQGHVDVDSVRYAYGSMESAGR